MDFDITTHTEFEIFFFQCVCGIFSVLLVVSSHSSSSYYYNVDFIMDTTEELELFVPGRLCILGEHSDWAGEYRKTNGSIPYGTISIIC